MSSARDSVVMVTDIVQSTSLARLVGDEWPAVLARHDEIVDRTCSRFDGRRSGFTGDGFSYVFDDLTGLDEGGGLEPAVVDVLVARGASPGSTAAEAIGSRSILLVLDNCEHAAAVVRSLCEELVAACPRLRLVTTSRHVLGIDGERVWFAPPLPDAAAVELFHARAAIAIGRARADALDPIGVAEVCGRVDCMPLAIELVAARLRALGLVDLLAHLDDQPRLLVDRSRSTSDRRHGLATAIGQSVDTLDQDGHAVFRALSVFRGGAALDGICAVTPDHDSLAVLDALEELVDASLVQRSDGPDGRPRYRQLEPVRQFADRGLVAAERSELQDRHASWVERLVGPAGREVVVRPTARQLLDAESANIEQALGHLVSMHRVAEAMRLVGALGYYWFSHRPALGWDLTKRVLDSATGDESPRVRAAALVSAGPLALQRHCYGEALDMLTEALELLGDHPSRARGWALYHLGRTAAVDDRAADAIPAFEAATEDFLQVGDPLGHAWSLLYRAQLCADVDAARRMADELLALARSEGLDQVLPAALLGFEAQDAFRSGRPDEAYGHLAEAASILERLGDLWQLADIRIGSAALTLSFDQPRYWHFLGLAAKEMGHEAAMAHAQHFIGVAAEGLRRRGRSALACELAWAVDLDRWMLRDAPPWSDFASWVDRCRALGPAPRQPLDRDEAVALAVAAILPA